MPLSEFKNTSLFSSLPCSPVSTSGTTSSFLIELGCINRQARNGQLVVKLYQLTHLQLLPHLQSGSIDRSSAVRSMFRGSSPSYRNQTAIEDNVALGYIPPHLFSTCRLVQLKDKSVPSDWM